jgi:flagellar biosynthetic protein FliO
VLNSVTGHKRKIVALAASAVLIVGLAALRAARAGGAAPAREKAGLEGGSLFANDSNLWSQGNELGTSDLVSKTLVAVLIVAGFGGAAIYASKKFLPRLANLPGREIRIVETAHLGPRKAVHLVKIGNQRFLVGSTNESITMLASLTDGLSEMDFSAEEAEHFESSNGR